MPMKRLTSILLFITMSFSILHGVVVDYSHENHCDSSEYTEDFSVSIHYDGETHEHESDTLCDSHFMYHLSFLVPQNFLLDEINQEISLPIGSILSYFLTPRDKALKPPIV